MKICKEKDALILEPETEFERDTLLDLYGLGASHTAFIKTGITLADVVGLKIPFKKDEKAKKD